MSNIPELSETPISIALPPKYWTIILALVDTFVNTTAKAEIDKLRSSGADPKNLPPEKVTALAGPFFIKGTIIKELAAHNVLKPEANEKMGIDALLEYVAKNSKA